MKGKRIEQYNVLEEIRFFNELNVLRAYHDGLSFGEFLVALRGKDIRRHYMTARTIENTITELKKRQIKPIKLLDSDGTPVIGSKNPPVVPLDEVRLNKDLRRLDKLGYVTKKKDGRYFPLLATQDMLTICEHKHILNNFLELEKERAREIQQEKIKPKDLYSSHIIEGETTIYSPLFMSKKHRRRYEEAVHRIAQKFNRTMDELYSLIQQHSIKYFRYHHPLVTVVIDEPWRLTPEEEKSVFNKDMEVIKKVHPEYAKYIQSRFNLKEKKQQSTIQ